MTDGARDPGFFIVGAAKCATTSMYRYLRAHPQIFMPDRVEMSYFGSDLLVPNRIPGLDAYRAHFVGAGADQVVGEKSVNYLFSERAAVELRDFNPAAKAIIMLRNPADMVFSLHKQFLYSANEDIVDLNQALEAEVDRSEGRRIPAGAHNPSLLRYRAVATFTPQVRRYLDEFGPDRVHVVLFDDLIVDPDGVYRCVLEFLSVDPDHEVDFAVHNPAKRVPNIGVRKLMKTHQGLSRVLHRVLPQSVLDGARDGLAKLQQQPAKELDPDTRARLVSEFEPDISSLADLLGRDLSAWMRTS